MRSFFGLVFLASVALPLARAQQTVAVTSVQTADARGVFSDGSAWPVDRGFRFELGTFRAGFDPATASKATWAQAWIPVSPRTSIPGLLQDGWYDERDASGTAFRAFAVTGRSVALAGQPTPAPAYYVWGYNNRAFTEGAEWILLTNPSWTVTRPASPGVVLYSLADAGTTAVVGTIAGSGRTLSSARVKNGPEIFAFTGNVTVASGASALLRVNAGSDALYQWYEGSTGDTSRPIAGQTRPELFAAPGRYWARATEGAKWADSATSVVTAAPADSTPVITAEQRVLSFGYIPGRRVAVTVKVSYPVTPARLDLAVLVPASWHFLSDSTNAVSRPAVGGSDVLEWSWTQLPADSFEFIYVLMVPAGITGDQALTTLLGAVKDGALTQSLVRPDPLLIPAGPQRHSADVDRDGRVSLAELTRVIELYNARTGPVRTGAYAAAANSEDGFAPAAATPTPPAVFHTADFRLVNGRRDGRIDLQELMRVIELYNTRSSTVRTGAYHPRGDTEDGFVPGPAP